ncbi:acyl-CoA synthetase (AMP-forming)/AMP-acid ligase II [Marinobacter oulmenensis]|uniref:Acyl-CoA synthetase (AMP-forming)/AMP-acid ligase II n=1 Tax=Marinobacter oulmenensis TaxID=643747 RepID=A0A840U6D4_9GAMM|nr:acyl-CoA synthetase (AMP-forming)/AMP-acid ligase II [Marinobacter oulmenensis]
MAIIYDDEVISYGELYHRVTRMASLLHAKGIGQNDVVAMFMKNSPAFVEIALAISYVGAVFLPINFRLAAGEAEHILKDAGAKLLFMDEEFARLKTLGFMKIIVGAVAQGDSRHLVPDDLPAPYPVQRSENDLMRLMYTSGTTSRPKGVMHTYGNFYWKSFDHIIALSLTCDQRLLVVGPLYHVGAFDLPGMAVMLVGGSLVLHRDFDPEQVLASIERHKITCGWMAPVMLSRVLATDNPGRFDLSSFQWCIAGGEKTPEVRIRDFTRVFSDGRFIDGFGMTETCSGDTLMEPGREFDKIGSVGRALAHVEIRIVDSKGMTLPPNTQGEICVRGPKVTKGYWNAPDKTAESFFDDWLRTGDIGVLDDEGFLFITDRAKDMILTGAENVASCEVEGVIYELDQVAEAAVIGVPDVEWGERIVAAVVPNPDADLTYEQLRDHCRAQLAGFKVPRELHIFEQLPRNPSGKILKRRLREDLQERSRGNETGEQ